MIALQDSWLGGLGLWALTYLAHSTLLLLTASLLHRVLPSMRDAIWKTALFGALLTATMHVGLEWQPLSGRLALFERTPINEAATPTSIDAATWTSRPSTEPASSPLSLPEIAPPTLTPRLLDGLRDAPWSRLALAAWLLGAASLATAMIRRQRGFRRSLADRRDVTEPALVSRLAELSGRAAGRATVRLTSTSRISVPFARGWLRPEICLPERVLSQMSLDEQEAILAHELAHHERRDPLWRLLSESAALILFFQPLNRLACLRIREHAELCCDGRAVGLTGKPAALARCLAEIAGWAMPDSNLVPVPALGRRGSGLSQRVGRLLDAPESLPQRQPRTAILIVAALLGMVVTLAPGFSLQTPPPEPPAPVVAPLPLGAAEPQATHLLPPTFAEPPAPSAVVTEPPTASTVVATPPTPALAPAAAPAPLALSAAEPTPPLEATAPEPTTPPQEPTPVEEVDIEDEAELETAMEEIEEAMETLESILEETIEAAMEEVEEALETQLDGFEEQIEEQMEGIEDEVEGLADQLEDEMDALDEELENAPDDETRATIRRQMEERARALGELGSVIGSTIGAADIGSRISRLMLPLSEWTAEMSRNQATIAQAVAEQMKAIHLENRGPTDAEMEALKARLEELRTEMAPRREQLEKMRRDMEEQMDPLRRDLDEVHRRTLEEIERWKRDNAALLPPSTDN